MSSASEADVAEVEHAVEVLRQHGIVSPLEAMREENRPQTLTTVSCANVADRLSEAGYVIEAERVRWADADDRYDLARELAAEYLDVGDIRRM